MGYCVSAWGRVDFFFCETALVGLTESRVHIAVERRERGAEALVYWLEAPERILSTLVVWRICFLVAASIESVHFVTIVAPLTPIVATVAALGVLALVISHLIPRAIAKRFSLPWARYSMWFIRVLTWLSAPVVWPLLQAGRTIGGLTGFVGGAFWTPGELDRVSSAARADALGKPNEQLILSMLEFSDTVIREIMMPRTEMVDLAVDASPEEICSVVKDEGHARIPVYEDTVDNIIGILHVKDLIAEPSLGSNNFDLRKHIRRTFYVPEVMKISELLREFQKRKTHMAIVVDEYGGTAGLVTLEDILEEIVGDIQDEHDVDEKQFRVLADGKILADGRVSLWDLESVLGVDFPEEGDYETLAGFLVAQAGYLPRAGSMLNWGELDFTVKEADERRIATVEIARRAVRFDPQVVS